ncbi:MAG: peptidylprolyl isomerase [Longimicrobiales bacterium]|nr:peptidylprolyl isomerase [Longimicrobiales bacterium]
MPLPASRRPSPAALCRAAFAATLTSAAACAAPPPALEVAGIGYAERDLLGLTPARRQILADLTALGAAVARGEVAAVGAPLLARRADERLWERVQVERILREAGVTDEHLAARYATAPEHRLTVRHLIVLSDRSETDARRGAARARAEMALARIRAGEAFPQVAAEVSEEPGAESRQGLLTPGRRGAWVDEFWAAASALEVGEVSGVVETQYGYHVLRLEGRQVVPFAEVRDQAADEVARQLGRVEPSTEGVPLPDGFALAAGLDTLNDPGARAATWNGGSAALEALLDHAATLEPERWRAVREGAPGSRREAAEAVARRRAVRAAAAALGLPAPDGNRVRGEPEAQTREGEVRAARVEAWAGDAQAWAAEVEAWAAVLGFRAGMAEEALKEAALAGLSATGQAAGLTRDAVTARRGLLERHFGSAVPGTRTAAGADAPAAVVWSLSEPGAKANSGANS